MMQITRPAYEAIVKNFDLSGFECTKCNSKYGSINVIVTDGEETGMEFSCTKCLSLNTVELEIVDKIGCQCK